MLGFWPTPGHLSILMLIQASSVLKRAHLSSFHPCTTYSKLRTPEEELKIEFERPPDSDEVVALYQCPDQTLPPQVHFFDCRPNASHSRPVPPGELDALGFPLFWPTGQLPFTTSCAYTRLKWIRFLLFHQLSRFTLSTTLFQSYILTLWNEVECSRIHAIRSQQRRRIPQLNSHVADAQDRQTGSLPATFHGCPAFYTEHVGAALFTASKRGFNTVLFTTMTQPPHCPVCVDIAADSERPSTSQVDNPIMDLLVRAYLYARDNLHTVMKQGQCLPRHLVTSTVCYLESIEFQGPGLPHVHP